MRVAIDAQILPGREGGIEQVLIGLAHGFSKLNDSNDRYSFVSHWQAPSLLEPYLGVNESIIVGPAVERRTTERIKDLLGPLRKPAGDLRRRLMGFNDPMTPALPPSNPFFDALSADIFHMTYPLHAFKSHLPVVFTIHDLQHRHLPHLFPEEHLVWREAIYPAIFEHAKAIVAISRWVLADVHEQYGVPLNKLFYVPWSSPTSTYAHKQINGPSQKSRKSKLPERFILYPALTYAHKNHIALLEAIALLRDKDATAISLVCTGALAHSWPQIKIRMDELALHSQVQFEGFVSTSDLKELYRRAEFVVLPSLFEGAGLPLLEAFGEGKAIACSDIPAFREYGANAALYFDPTSVESIAEGLKLLWSNESLRASVAFSGCQRAQQFSWEHTARVYRAIYRFVVGHELNEADQEILKLAHAEQSTTVSIF